MTTDQEKAREKLERLCQAMVSDLDATPDEELLEEVREAGEDLEAIVERVSALISDAIAEAGHRQLADARTEYDAQRGGQPSKVLKLPLERKRALIMGFAQNDGALREKLTLAARNGEDTEGDVDGFLEDLIDLGVIDDEGNVT